MGECLQSYGFFILIAILFPGRRRHTRFDCDWSSDVCSSDLVLQKPWVAEKLCKALAKKVKGKVDVVIGPAMSLRRGFSIGKNEKVLVVEDVVTTGKSSREVIELVKQNGAKLTGIACVVDRSEGNAGFDVLFY